MSQSVESCRVGSGPVASCLVTSVIINGNNQKGNPTMSKILQCCEHETVGRVDSAIVQKALADIREHQNPDTVLQASDLKDAARHCGHPLHALEAWDWHNDKGMAEQARDAVARQLLRIVVLYSPPPPCPRVG